MALVPPIAHLITKKCYDKAVLPLFYKDQKWEIVYQKSPHALAMMAAQA